jgi:UDP-glucose:(heptosyl)LPS alpha-1,3-glucosyltransferase
LAYLWLEKKQFSYHPQRLLIAVSKGVKSDVQANYHSPDRYIALAPPGVEMPVAGEADRGRLLEAVREKYGIAKDNLVILFVGNEFKRKGLDNLLKGFALLHQVGLRLVIAGGGEQKDFQRLASDLGIESRVIFLGLVKEMPPIYAMADIFALPTLSDPFGMAPLEAMAFGIPTIVSNSRYAGCAELFNNGEALILDDPGDPNEIAAALNRLLDPANRKELSKRGLDLAEKLTWDRTTAETLAVYEKVVKAKELATRHRSSLYAT